MPETIESITLTPSALHDFKAFVGAQRDLYRAMDEAECDSTGSSFETLSNAIAKRDAAAIYFAYTMAFLMGWDPEDK